MLTQSIDVYAATNPALCSLIMWSFLVGYSEADAQGCELPLAFLPIPIVLSRDLLTTFSGTGNKTGVITWTVRSPQISIGLPEKIHNTQIYTRQAILFGTSYNLISVSANGLLLPGQSSIPDRKINTRVEEIKVPIRLAKRLGIWFGQVKSTETIFSALGLSL